MVIDASKTMDNRWRSIERKHEVQLEQDTAKSCAIMLAKFGGEENVKTHQRLDSFLQRSLKKDAYDKIRVAEPCVVCCGKYNRVFKFVVLGSTSLYVLENPPRTAKDILLHVTLKSLKEVRLVDEIPSFFNDDLKKRVQHISIEAHSGAIHSPSASANSSHPSQSNSSSFNSFHSKTSNTSLLDANQSDFNLYKTQSREEVPLFKSFSSVIETAACKSRKLPSPPAGMEKCNASAMSELKPLSRSLSTPSSHSPKGKASSSRRSLPHVSLDNPGEPFRRSCRSSSMNEGFFGLSTTNENKTRSTHSLRSLPTETNPISSGINLSSSSRSLSLQYAESTNSDTNKINNVENQEDMNKMNIYLLSSKSNFYYHLEAAWIHSIMEANSNSFTRLKTKVNDMSQKFVQKFVELQNEIMVQPPIETLCILTKELYCSLKSLFLVKKLFWKEQKLFEYYSLLGSQLWRDTSGFDASYAGQLDCLLLIYQVLAAAIEETETLSQRNQYLYCNGIDTVHLLVCSLARWPKLFKVEKKRKRSQEMQALLNGTGDQTTGNELKTELEVFEEDFIDGSISLLYQLLNLAKQGQLLYHIESSLSPSSISAFMCSSNGFNVFVSCWVDRLVNLLSYSNDDNIEFTLAYKHLLCLHQLIESNEDIKRLFKSKHSEEFRYYILSPRTISKLSNSPLSRLLLIIIEKLRTVMINT